MSNFYVIKLVLEVIFCCFTKCTFFTHVFIDLSPSCFFLFRPYNGQITKCYKVSVGKRDVRSAWKIYLDIFSVTLPVLRFKILRLWINFSAVTIQMKTVEWYFLENCFLCCVYGGPKNSD